MTHRTPRPHSRPVATALVALFALACVTAALWNLTAGTRGLDIVGAEIEGVPITLYRPIQQAGPTPAVVVAHGFAGSRRLMEPYAASLARNGYLVVTFDFPGHGDNRTPFVANLEDEETRLRLLTGALGTAADFALAQPDVDGRLGLLGHSMAGDPLVRYAAEHRQQVGATVLLSPYLSEGTPTGGPRNLLLLYGALEPDMLHEQGFSSMAEMAGGDVEAGVVYGDLTDGDARSLVLAEGAEHIGVLYSDEAIGAARDWLDRAFHRQGSSYAERRGPWIGLLYLGLLALAWPLSRALPRVTDRPLGAGLPWRRLWPVAIAPALLTPLLLWQAPTNFLPILLADYLALHFGLYGLLTGAGLWLTTRGGAARPRAVVRWRNLLIAMVATGLYAVLLFALATDAFVTALLPSPWRMPLVLVVLIGTLIYFAADEWLIRGPGAATGAPFLTRTLFLVSLLLAVALNLNELFFLIIIVPAILVLFVVYGLMNRWVYQGCGHPVVGASASAVAFASAIATTFPVVAS